MNAVFLSDAHIRDHRDENLPPLLAFLDTLHGQIDRLFVVGDLFDTWFAFSKAVFDEYVPLLGALERLVRGGAKIVYVTGNHDFEMGLFFTQILCAEVHDSEMTLEADGRRVFVAHGDLANTRDRAYRRLRWLLRNRFTRWLGRQLPPRWVWAVSQGLRATCHGKHDAEANGMREVFARYAAQKHDEGFDTVILAHLHAPAFETTEGPGGERTYVNLGEWFDKRTFLRWSDGRLELKQWDWPEAVERPWQMPSPS